MVFKEVLLSPVLALLLSVPYLVESGLSEADRLEEAARRGYTWPPRNVTPDTEVYRDLLWRREAQTMAMGAQNQQERWDAWINLGKMAVVRNFTEHGFAVEWAPEALHRKLYEALHAGMGSDAEVDESFSTQVFEIEVNGSTFTRPGFVHVPELIDEVMADLKPLHEKWAGVPLVGNNAYGLRIYKNLSTLLMHIDKTDTHVISSILHVDHKYDDDQEPWPIEIEDLSGEVQAVDLKPGQMLFYESAKCLHGRPKRFKGSYYVSVFTHYYPQDWKQSLFDATYIIPAYWADNIQKHPQLLSLAKSLPLLRGAGTGIAMDLIL